MLFEVRNHIFADLFAILSHVVTFLGLWGENFEVKFVKEKARV